MRRLCSALIIFLIVLISRNCFKLQKFVETCRNVQNLQNKFCMTPLEPLFTVGLAKFTFDYHFIVQNSKNSDTKIIFTNIYARK
jgi:hypothetical protein